MAKQVVEEWERTTMQVPAGIVRAVALVATIFVGSTSASADTTAPAEALARYKRIGVVSITAQMFSRVQEGMFSVEREQIDISSWDVDAQYEQQIGTGLAAIEGFEVVQRAYSRSEFFRLAYGKDGFRWDGLQSPLRRYCEENQVDAVMVAFAAYSQDFVSGTRQRISGAGFISGLRGAALHLVTIVALFDCESARSVAARGLASLRDGARSQIIRASPVMASPPEVARTPLKELTDSQIAAIRKALIDLPMRSWAPTLGAILGK